MLWLLVVSVVLSIFEAVGEKEEGRNYEDSCSCDTDCNSSKWLSCQNGKCLCLSTAFVYDYSRGSCVVKLGGKCFEVASDYNFRGLPPFIRCVEGAFCSMHAGGVCVCNLYGYFESENGDWCEDKKEFGMKCGHSSQCKSDNCSSEGNCICKSNQYYQRDKEKCLSLVGSYCFNDEECSPYALCIDGSCKCTQGYSPTTDGHCRLELQHGDSCSPTNQCNNPTLACRQEKCQCRYPAHQIVDAERNQCLTLVHSAPCNNAGNYCVNGATCHESRDGFSECRCSKDLLEMGDGTCGKWKGHGDSCNGDEECDPVTPLVCKNFICECADSLTFYDTGKRICRGLHGFRNCTSSSSCTDFSVCVQYNPNLPPKCLCEAPSYKPNADRSCVPS